MGCDKEIITPDKIKDIFQSTHPSWGATLWTMHFVQVDLFQSTHPSWGATWCSCFTCFDYWWISIHAPIVGCDAGTIHKNVTYDISIHAPIVGCDFVLMSMHVGNLYFNPRTHRGVRQKNLQEKEEQERFQSTHPSWGATIMMHY